MIERPLGDPEIAVEILRLRVAELEEAIRRLAEQDATLSVQGGNVTVTMDATLTDEERDAVEWASKTLCVGWHDLAPSDKQRTRDAADTLRGMLARCAIGHQDGPVTKPLPERKTT